jgi:hypothetical protein
MSTLPISHKLNKRNINKLIERADQDIQHIVDKIFQVTEHISYEYFITFLNKNIEYSIKYVKQNVMYLCIVNYDNYWIIEYIQLFMSKKYPYIFVKILENTKDYNRLNDDEFIFLVDDCIYSGESVCESIKDILTVKKTNIMLIISFMTEEGRDTIVSLFKKHSQGQTLMISKYIHYIYPITDYITLNQLAKVYYFYDIFLIKNELLVYPIYFDHSIAGTDKTFTELYSGIVPNMHNKIIIERYEKKNDPNILKDLEIFPLIKNCENFKITDLSFTERCPSSSFKVLTSKRRKSNSLRKSSIKSSKTPFKIIKTATSPKHIINRKRTSTA